MYKPSTTYLLAYSNNSAVWFLCGSVKGSSCVTDVDTTALSQMDARCSTVHMCAEGYRGTLNQCSRTPDVPQSVSSNVCVHTCMCVHAVDLLILTFATFLGNPTKSLPHGAHNL